MPRIPPISLSDLITLYGKAAARRGTPLVDLPPRPSTADLLADPLVFLLLVRRYDATPLLRAVRRLARNTQPAPDSPDHPPLRHTVAEIAAVWSEIAADPFAAPRFGSLLLDVQSFHDAVPVFHWTPESTLRFKSRPGGLKRWLERNLPQIPYPSAMQHKSLAALLLRACRLPEALPASALFYASPPPPRASASLRTRLADARKSFQTILDAAPSVRALRASALRLAPPAPRLPPVRLAILSPHPGKRRPALLSTPAALDDLLARAVFLRDVVRRTLSRRPSTPEERAIHRHVQRLLELASAPD